MPDGTEDFCSSDVDVKGRGHSTFTKPKKPYAIRLDGRHPLLGMAPGKRWALLANFMDHSLMRNMLALELARRTSLAWTPDCRQVDVVVNGQPQGCYLLCEQIRVARGRVEIEEKRGFLSSSTATTTALLDSIPLTGGCPSTSSLPTRRPPT